MVDDEMHRCVTLHFYKIFTNDEYVDAEATRNYYLLKICKCVAVRDPTSPTALMDRPFREEAELEERAEVDDVSG